MATAEDYEEVDYTFVREEVLPSAWAPPNPNTPHPEPWTWFGIVQDNTRLPVDPTPSTNTARPSMYAVWRLDYDEVQGDYGGQAAPVRYGRLIVALYLQKGAKEGHLRMLRTALLRQINAAPDEPLGFTVQEAKGVTIGYIGPWYVENEVIPFCGG